MKKKNNYRNYSLVEKLKLAYFVLRTKILFGKARIIRFPIRVRGKQYMQIEKGFTTGYNCRLDVFPINNEEEKRLVIGEFCEINDNVHIAAVDSVKIGKNVLIASRVYISDHDHGSYEGNEEDDSPMSKPGERQLKYAPVEIKDNVWLGQNVSILKGVTIGEGAIIGAHSLVTKDIPANSIAIGTPAKVVKKFNFDTKKWERVS